MRILQINTVANSLSTGRITEEIGNMLLENGHESYIAHGRKQLNSTSNLIKIGTNFDAYAHGAYTRLTDRHGFASVRATKALIAKIRTIKPDLIALHNLHGYYINIQLLFTFIKESSIPVVWTLFDCWAFTGHCSYFDDINCTKWKTQCMQCPKHKKYPKSFVDNSRLNFNDKKNLFTNVNNLEIVTHSKWLGNLVNQSFLSEYKVNVSPSAINLDLFKPLVSDLKEKFDIKDKRVILGCASVWSTRKGLDDFLKLNKIIGKEYQIVLIGLNMKQIKLLPDTIIGINRTESIEELAKWYSLASVFVNPTTQDNFPTTNIEALACGTPIVTYNTGGSPEAIDKEIGEVVEKGDVHGLYDAIKHLASMNQKTLSDRCLKHAQNEFDKRIRYLDYLDIFKKCQ